MRNLSLLLLRLVLAAIFIYATYGKWMMLQAPPEGLPPLEGGMFYLTWLLMIAEPLGALALILGLLTRLAAAGLAIIMLGSLFVLRLSYGTAIFTSLSGVGLDYNALILVGCLVLVAFGAGSWAVSASEPK